MDINFVGNISFNGTEDTKEKEDFNVYNIIGNILVFFILVLITFIVLLCLYCYFRRKESDKEREEIIKKNGNHE